MLGSGGVLILCPITDGQDNGKCIEKTDHVVTGDSNDPPVQFWFQAD